MASSAPGSWAAGLRGLAEGGAGGAESLGGAFAVAVGLLYFAPEFEHLGVLGDFVQTGVQPDFGVLGITSRSGCVDGGFVSDAVAAVMFCDLKMRTACCGRPART